MGKGMAAQSTRPQLAAQQDAHAALVRENAMLRALLEDSQRYVAKYLAQLEKLTEVVVAMKREGFVPEASTGEPAKPVELPAIIETAITDLGVDPATERQLRKTAWELKRSNVADEEIAQRITEGEPVEL